MFRPISYQYDDNKQFCDPFTPYSARNFIRFTMKNKIGERFTLVNTKKSLTDKKLQQLQSRINEINYPLSDSELIAILNVIKKRVDFNPKSRLSVVEADKLFMDLGIYFRLGLLNTPPAQRYAILKTYSLIYNFRFRLNEWSNEDIAELQRLADLGLTITEISDYVGRRYTDVQRVIKQNHIVLLVKPKEYRVWDSNALDTLNRNIGKKSFKEISETIFTDCTISNLTSIAKKYNFSVRNRKWFWQLFLDDLKHQNNIKGE